MMPPKAKKELSMANATWDQPATLNRTRVDRSENRSSRLLFHQSPKHWHPSSKRKRKHSPSHHANRFKSDKEIDQLLSLLRDPSFCRAGVSHENHVHPIPTAILCDSVPSPERRQSTDKQTIGQEIGTSLPTSRCPSLDLSLSDDATRSVDREFGWKHCKSREADRGHILHRIESATL